MVRPSNPQMRQHEIARRQIADQNETFMELVNHPANPMTREDLEALIRRRPERCSRFAGWINRLPSSRN